MRGRIVRLRVASTLALVVSIATRIASAEPEGKENPVAIDGAPAESKLTLADNGASPYRIVIAQSASPSEKHAAEELQTFLEQTTGARLPIVTDESPPQDREILLGDSTRLAALGIDLNLAALGDEGFLIRTAPPRLVIAGGSKRGTLYGVYAFLEDHLGCRWFTPTVSRIPNTPHLEIGPIEDRQVPALEYREAFFVTARDGDWAARNRLNSANAELTEKDLLLPPIHFEPAGGLYKWDGLYYACGQNANVADRPYHGRVIRLYPSTDFKTWSHPNAIAFVRDAQHTVLGPGHSREGEQTHEGISVWNRRNVLLGVFGIWHGATEWKDITIDLGFLLSNDGVNFREPAHEFTFIERGKHGQWDQGGVLQGQGFENVADETRIYYGSWDPRVTSGSTPRGGVGLATLPRDRFGDLVVEEAGKGTGDYQLKKIVSEFLTANISIRPNAPHRFFLNADGLGDHASLRIELLTDKLTPLPNYSGRNAAIVRSSGFHTPIEWNGQTDLIGLPDKLRIKVTFNGNQQSHIRFSAIYVQ